MVASSQTPTLRETPRGVTLEVEVKVRAKKTQIAGTREGRLSIALAAPPVDGAANAALREFLGDLFGVSSRAVEIVLGERHRRKVVELRGVSLAEASAVLGSVLE